MRKVVGLLFLALVAAGAWYGVRWFRQKDAVRATIVFDSARGIARGNDVVCDSVVIGKVSKVSTLENQVAVSITVLRRNSDQLLTDSLFSIEGDSPRARVEVISTVAVGRPVTSGEVIYAREDKIARWLARHGQKVAPLLRDLTEKASQLLEDYDSGRMEKEMEQWKAHIPEWRREGQADLDRRIEVMSRRVDEIEADLRKASRNADADRLRARFNAWLNEVRRKLAE